MKRTINIFICSLLPVLVLGACSTEEEQSFSVESSVSKLRSKGWTVGEDSNSYSDSDLIETTRIINLDLEHKEAEFRVQTIIAYISLFGPDTLSIDDPNWVPPRSVYFTVFANETDALNYYNLYVNYDYYTTRNCYFSLSENVCVETNSEDAKNLLTPLEFTMV